MYKVVKRFFDLRTNQSYSVGDTYPHGGGEVDAERLEELAGTTNKLGVPLIVKIGEKPKQSKKSKT